MPDEPDAPFGDESAIPAKSAEHRRLARAVAELMRDRELLAYDIHDGLSQYLAGAAMHLEACARSRLDSSSSAEVAEALRLVRQADAEARRLIEGGRPPALHRGGLGAAIEDVVAAARGAGLDARLTSGVPDATIPPHLAPSIYRIVHEAVENVRRHAAARTVQVVLDRCPNGLRIHVCDDGRGFDPTSVPRERIGLEGIRRRALLLGGTSRIESRAGAGTTVEVVLPM